MVLISSNSLQEQEWEKKTKCCFDEHHIHFLWCWIEKEKRTGVINIYKKTSVQEYQCHTGLMSSVFRWTFISRTVNVPSLTFYVCLCKRPYGHSLQAVFAAGWHSFNLPAPITVWWVTHAHAWFHLLAHVRKSVLLPLHVNPSCERKRFPNSITHFVLDQSIIGCALQTWLPCTQWSIRLLKAQTGKLSLDLWDHAIYDGFRC